MSRRARGSGRSVALLWGLLADIALVGILSAWLLTGLRLTAVGTPLTSALLAAAVLLTTLAMLVMMFSNRLARGVLFTVAVLVAVGAGGMAALTLAAVLAGDGSAVLLFFGPAGMGVLATHIGRAAIARQPGSRPTKEAP